MAYKKGSDRRQRVLFPDCIDEKMKYNATRPPKHGKAY